MAKIAWIVWVILSSAFGVWIIFGTGLERISTQQNTVMVLFLISMYTINRWVRKGIEKVEVIRSLEKK